MSQASGAVLSADDLPVDTPLGNTVNVCVTVTSARTRFATRPNRKARASIMLCGEWIAKLVQMPFLRCDLPALFAFRRPVTLPEPPAGDMHRPARGNLVPEGPSHFVQDIGQSGRPAEDATGTASYVLARHHTPNRGVLALPQVAHR